VAVARCGVFAGLNPISKLQFNQQESFLMKSIITTIFAGIIGLSALAATAADDVKTVAAIHKDKATLSGKTIQVQGKVVKVNNGIMGRNFIHVQDGTGDKDTNNLVVTSQDTANVGAQVKVSGLVVLNRDFGMGYSYPLLIEEAKVTPK
jgi:DNA/RNA endonuclease YhcR with UshA esterase domain